MPARLAPLSGQRIGALSLASSLAWPALRTAPAGVTVALEVLRPPEMPPVAAPPVAAPPPAPVYQPPPPVAVARGSVTAPARGSVAVRRKTAAAATGDRVAAHLEAAADAAAERRAAAAAAAHAVTQAATQRLAHLTGRRGKSSGAPAYAPPSPDKFGPLTQLGRAAAHGAVNPKTAQRALAGARASWSQAQPGERGNAWCAVTRKCHAIGDVTSRIPSLASGCLALRAVLRAVLSSRTPLRQAKLAAARGGPPQAADWTAFTDPESGQVPRAAPQP